MAASSGGPCSLTAPRTLLPIPRRYFGPVGCVGSFATVDEAVQLAADTDFGLSLGIITPGVTAAVRLAEQSLSVWFTSTIRP